MFCRNRFQEAVYYMDSEVGSIHDTLVGVRTDCMWISEQYQKFANTLMFDLSDRIDDFYHNVYQNVYIELTHLPKRYELNFNCLKHLNTTQCHIIGVILQTIYLYQT